MGHGWVVPNPGGVVARCGGPAICRQCQEEARGQCVLCAMDRDCPQHPGGLTEEENVEPHKRG